jgi:hypothetical protein
MRLLRIAFLFMLIFIALIFFYYVPAIEKQLSTIADYKTEVGIYLPFIALILIIGADRYIQKDEKLIRSADRLR